MSFALAHQSKTSEGGINTKTSSIAKHSSSHPHIDNLKAKDSPNNIIHLQRTIGNQAVQSLVRSENKANRFDFAEITIQPKLKISQPGDEYEQEADRVAEQVMRIPSPSDLVVPIGTTKDDERIDRKCVACEMKEKEDTKMKIRINSSIVSMQTRDQIADGIDNIRSCGSSSLDSSTREFMESRFGYDFRNIRIHTERMAARSAENVNALAYTVGNDIVFANGQYQPNMLEGRKLLAHELAHVIQQGHATHSTVENSQAKTWHRNKEHRSTALTDRINGDVQYNFSDSNNLSSIRIGSNLHATPHIGLQRKFVATGATTDFLAILNSIITVQHKVEINSTTGELSIKSTDIQGPPTLEQQMLLQLLKNVVDDPGNTVIDFTNGSRSVIVGSYALSTIDLADVRAFGIGQQRGVSAAGKLAHEIEEQYQKQVKGKPFGTETSEAHGSGISMENAVTGATRGPQGPTRDLVRESDGSLSFKVTIPYIYPNGTIVDVEYTVSHNNVISVSRVERRRGP